LQPLESQRPRERLLAAAVDYVASHGIGDLRLRDLAAAIGTSHRMLIYHFGSKEGLLVAIVLEVERAQRQFLSEVAADPSATPSEVARVVWRRISDPRLAANVRLFFEIYSQALQGRPGTAGFLDDIVDSWVELLMRYGVQRGVPPAAARADPRLAVAVARGLLLDLAATGQREAVEEAFERYAGFYASLLTRTPTESGVTTEVDESCDPAQFS
jgi:AcrR family transcriptional regulator